MSECCSFQATYYGTTALTYSIRSGNEQAVKLLLARPEINVNFQVTVRMVKPWGWILGISNVFRLF
jgi:hypothetical protein